MTHTLTTYTTVLVLILMLAFGFTSTVARAHSEGDAADQAAHAAELSDATPEQKERLVTLLKQLVTLLTVLKAKQMSAVQTPVTDHEMDEHHDEHATETEHDEHADEEAEVAKLIIEIEPHNGQTHAHVRYVDKPEEMFFVTAPITDEDGIVAGIVAKTGLTADVVRAALKYMQ